MITPSTTSSSSISSYSRASRNSRVSGPPRILRTQVIEKNEKDFTENGGIRERMTAARLGRRQTQNEEIAALRAENDRFRQEIESLKRELRARKGC